MPEQTGAQRHRWECTGRYYEAHLARDLFDQWVLTRVWGQRGSSRGRVVHTPCNSYREACNHLAKLVTRRRQRGYTPVITH